MFETITQSLNLITYTTNTTTTPPTTAPPPKKNKKTKTNSHTKMMRKSSFAFPTPLQPFHIFALYTLPGTVLQWHRQYWLPQWFHPIGHQCWRHSRCRHHQSDCTSAGRKWWSVTKNVKIMKSICKKYNSLFVLCVTSWLKRLGVFSEGNKKRNWIS